MTHHNPAPIVAVEPITLSGTVDGQCINVRLVRGDVSLVRFLRANAGHPVEHVEWPIAQPEPVPA